MQQHMDTPENLLKNNSYPGRGIIIGKNEAENSVIAYFIMGRSANSRNRVFEEEADTLMIYPADESKVEDPSLIIYAPVRTIANHLIVTNGDQTDTIYEFLKEGKSFEEALRTRCFEPDAPNFTPRISGWLNIGDFSEYKLSILKAMDEEGKDCERFTYQYTAKNGLGHLIHTYESDGNPLQSFAGEPRRVKLNGETEEIAKRIWESLDEKNRISLYVCTWNGGEKKSLVINRFQRV